MRNDEWTEIVCVLDRSGSMGGFEEDTIGGFNAFVARQREEEGKARLSLVLFDDHYEIVWRHVDLEQIEALDARRYYVRGSTALLDAVGKTINGVRGKIEAMHPDERPSQVVVLVMTDGQENASKEYTGPQVRELVEEVEDEGWEFVFIGADIDAFGAAEGMAMKAGSATNIAKSKQGMREAYAKMNRAVTLMRRTGSKGDVDTTIDEDEWL